MKRKGNSTVPKSPSQVALSQKSAKTDPARAAVRASVRVDDDSQRTAVAAARAALEKKAEDVVVLDLRGVSGYTDFLVISTGQSDRQLETISEGVEKELKDHSVVVESHPTSDKSLARHTMARLHRTRRSTKMRPRIPHSLPANLQIAIGSVPAQ